MTDPDKLEIPLKSPRPSSFQQRNRRDRLLISLTVALVLLAWFYGYFTSGIDVAPLVTEVIPTADRIEPRGQLFIGLDADDRIVGYAATGQAPGYGGPIEILVGVDRQGQILGVKIISQRESPGFFRLVENDDLMGQYSGLAVTAPLQLGHDLDAVTGATVSAEGVVNAVNVAVREIAAAGLNIELPPRRRSIQFGLPEIVLISLFVAGYFAHKLRRPLWKRRMRWATLLTGMVVLGFIYTAPFTITMVVSLLSGYWPDWHNNLYWYLLLGGIIFVTTVDAKNPYCHWFCPFGAFQECLATISGAKPYRPRALSHYLTWIQRGLALGAVILGLAFRSPGVAGYEPFATLFDFRGTTVQWIFLAVIILSSFAVYRPFCSYLCPLDAVVDFIATGRRWLKEIWKKWRHRPAKA